MTRRTIVLAALAVVAIGGWYAFRPERAFIDTTVNESFAVASSGAMDDAAMPVASGEFYSVAHETSGTATIYRLPDGSRVLRLTDFTTSNGPDVRVYLAAAAEPRDNASVTDGGFVELGKLKGNQGDQNYEVPAALNLSGYRAVTIWCKRFGVNFGSAPLRSSAG